MAADPWQGRVKIAAARPLCRPQPTSLRPRHIRMRKIVALEQKLGPVRFGAGVGQAVAEIQAGAVFAALAVALEGGDGVVGDGLLGPIRQRRWQHPDFAGF